MNRLSNDERDKLRKVAESIISKDKIIAICAYGSKVAGYAREDSDYDLLIISRDFADGIKYFYIDEPLSTSALVVDELLLKDDAISARLGEFVIGRLLNIYDGILNNEFIHGLEIIYKKRVMIEAINELSSDYGEFAQNIIIPYEFFLFDKLKKRAMLYPPALYSYVKTYTCNLAKENLDFTIDGFRDAAMQISKDGYIIADSYGIRIVPNKLKGDALTKLLSIFSLTARGVTQYAVHGYAGRVGLGIFRKEALSKVRRFREGIEAPEFMERPRKLLKVEEGIIIDDASFLNDEVAKLYGMSSYTYIERSVGELYSTARVVSLKGDGHEVTFVIKHFSDFRSLKWAILGLWAITARKFSMAPASRLNREYNASRKLRALGINTPRIIAVAPNERIIVKEFVDGSLLSELIDSILHGKSDDITHIKNYAKVIALAHRSGFSLGDIKPSNAIISNGKIYLTDLEQAVEGGDISWDIAEFLYYIAKLSLKEEGIVKVASAFLSSYRESNGKEAIANALNPSYLVPFKPFLAPKISKLLRDLMKEYSS